MGLRFDFNESTLASGLETKIAGAMPRLLQYVKTKASVIEADMKVNRPWTDRTGAAKATLNVIVEQKNDTTVRITLAHGVHYGIWLEMAKEKKYAIVAPTIKKFAPEILEELKDIGIMDVSISGGASLR